MMSCSVENPLSFTQVDFFASITYCVVTHFGPVIVVKTFSWIHFISSERPSCLELVLIQYHGMGVKINLLETFIFFTLIIRKICNSTS